MNLDETHKRLTWKHNSFASAIDLSKHHDKLFWRNSKEDVLRNLEAYESEMFEGDHTAGVVKQKIKDLWEIYAIEATCVAPPWRNCVSRIEIAEKKAVALIQSTLLMLEDDPPSVSKEDVEMIENYKKDFHLRYCSAAKKCDQKFNAAAAVGTALIGFAAATAMASRKN